MNKQGVHYFKRKFTADLTLATQELTGETLNSVANSVALNQLPNYTDFTNLFDQYKIIGITMDLIYEGGNVQENDPPSGSIQLPTLYVCPDLDDEGALTFSQMLEHGKTTVHSYGTGGRIKKRFYIPPYVENYIVGMDDALAYAANPKKSPWIDCKSTTAAMTHGTLKMALSGSPNTSYKFKRVFTLHVMARNTV